MQLFFIVDVTNIIVISFKPSKRYEIVEELITGLKAYDAGYMSSIFLHEKMNVMLYISLRGHISWVKANVCEIILVSRMEFMFFIKGEKNLLRWINRPALFYKGNYFKRWTRYKSRCDQRQSYQCYRCIADTKVFG